MRIVGIDPGVTGAVAALDDGRHPFGFFDTPTLTVKVGKKQRSVIDIAAAVHIIMELTHQVAHVEAVIERVSSSPVRMKGARPCPVCKRMPSPGAQGMFLFGESYGIWKGILAALQIPYTLVMPRTWKTAVMPDMPKEKGASILRAKQLFPSAAFSLNLKKHHNRADALLMAYWRSLQAPAKPEGFELEGGELPF